jgi:hypothetical protein
MPGLLTLDSGGAIPRVIPFDANGAGPESRSTVLQGILSFATLSTIILPGVNVRTKTFKDGSYTGSKILLQTRR